MLTDLASFFLFLLSPSAKIARGAICLNLCLRLLWIVMVMVRTITIRDEVYRKLLAVKREDESFSELLNRLVEGVNPVDVLLKLRGCVEFMNKEKLLSEIYMLRAERRL